MRQPTITELRLCGVLERGQPNKEAVALQAVEAVNMGRFGIFVGYQDASGQVLPYRDNFFWFGDGYVAAKDWLFVYTGEGESRALKTQDGTANIYVVHWGRPATMFANPAIVPVVFRMDGVAIPDRPVDQPQPRLLTPQGNIPARIK